MKVAEFTSLAKPNPIYGVGGGGSGEGGGGDLPRAPSPTTQFFRSAGMDWAAWGLDRLDWKFFVGIINIVIINLILSGDNAVVIAMAVRSLPRRQRLWGIILGAGAAVVLRVLLTFFVAQLLEVRFLKLAGGVLIAWIAVKLFVEGAPEQEDREAKTLLQAMWLIVVADITMSTDNVLAVAGASHGNFFLLMFGLALSIPFVVFTSNLLSMLMDRYPIIIYLGAAILGRVAAEMIFGDPWVVAWLAPPKWFTYSMEALFAVGVIVVGKLWLRFVFRRPAAEAAASDAADLSKEHPAPRPEEE
jgi:YjbE family integral membrane protein